MATYVAITFQKMCDISTSLGLNYNILLVAMQLVLVDCYAHRIISLGSLRYHEECCFSVRPAYLGVRTVTV